MRTVFVALLMSFSVPAFAQSSLGITGATFTFGMSDDEAGENRTEAATSVDVAITEVHGFQGDLRFADTVGGGIGGLGAHLYMAPRDGQKYGLFAQLSDVDGRSMMWGTIGAEGMVSLSEDTMLEVQGGIGASDVDGLDFVFAGLALSHAFSPSLELTAGIDIADFDESSFRAVSHEASLTLRYSAENSPWGAYASVTHSGLSGRDGADAATRIGFGISIDLGTAGGIDPSTRHFRYNDPVAPLIRRNLW